MFWNILEYENKKKYKAGESAKVVGGEGGWTLLPESDGVVRGPGREASAVGREGHGPNVAGVALQREPVSARGRVPESDGVVRGPGREASAVGREGHGMKRAGVALQREPVS